MSADSRRLQAAVVDVPTSYPADGGHSVQEQRGTRASIRYTASTSAVRILMSGTGPGDFNGWAWDTPLQRGVYGVWTVHLPDGARCRQCWRLH